MEGGNTFCLAIGSDRACQWRMSLSNSLGFQLPFKRLH